MGKRARNPEVMSGPPRGCAGAALSEWIVAALTDTTGLGFAAAGVCDATPPSAEAQASLRRWLDEGKHGEMSYLADSIGDRLDPRRVLPGARSVVMVADVYEPRTETATVSRRPSEPVGLIARYARGRDYHATIKRRLHRLADALRAAYPGHECRSFVDTAPVLEREFAVRAGLGWHAKNAMVIHPRLGSYMLLGGMLTTLELPPPAGQEPVTDHCGVCTRCIDACPTGAISLGPGARVDATRCVSYLTIEHGGAIDDSLAKKTGPWVFGCDVCQEVCPHNSPRASIAETAVRRPEYQPRRESVPLLEMAGWRKADRSLLTVSAMKRATAAMFRRNAVVALSRFLGTPGVRTCLERIADDEGEEGMVREAARRALDGA